MVLNKAKISRITLNYERSDFSFVIFLEEEDLFMEDYINISTDDIKGDDGKTESNTTHDAYVEDPTSVDYNDYGQN